MNGILPSVPVLSPTTHSLGSFPCHTVFFAFPGTIYTYYCSPPAGFVCLEILPPDHMTNYFRTPNVLAHISSFKRFSINIKSFIGLITSVPFVFFFLSLMQFSRLKSLYLFAVDILSDVNLGFLSSGAFFMIL